ncbi:MAG: DinB family protein, partial [Planctomycetes bacterium]|nr:DinB family protein [Planctomycetota bacterium]
KKKMDPDAFVASADFDRQTPEALIGQLTSLRGATVALFESFGEAELARTGIASGYSFTVRAIAWILVGHARHHMEILRERYLEG